ncbi:Gfo/Idh/MocA family protein [Sulfurovum sp. ST-21]|uniref:Gfo/Idh/MocA family oxidoreductase n=1 Tax=Sulfurovum indicum TaxID=2779528 RepID=A0A7M1S454_9BACT|nr:Gfo/Idh/MocA family oxidoreductase [Sulfurovum indicum]QOR62207.1 Gfo/Idh/MocA family oxidoreductase [Sulfurovum indicum]
MKHESLKIGFVGGGLNSAIGTTHKIATQMDGKFQLVAGCFSRHSNINSKTATQWSIPKYYTHYLELLEKEKNNLDAIAILTPTDSHTDIIIEILKFNIPIICEKTLTASLEDALKIKNIIDKNKNFLVTTYNYTGYPMIRELENMISTGKLGKIIQVNIQMPQESFIRLDKNGNIPKPQSWRLKDTSIPILSLDLGTHLSNMISFLTKETPKEVIAMQNNFGHYPVIDNLICMVKYTNNIDCQMWYSKSALGHKNGLKVEIYGTEGSASWYQMNSEFLEYNDNQGRNIILDRSSKDIEIADKERYNRFKSGHPAGFIEAFANHYTDIYEALRSYKSGNSDYLNKYVFDINASITELALMQTIETSIQSKKWEYVNVENKLYTRK